MIRPTDIIKHLKQYLGLFTDEFTSYLNVSSTSSLITSILVNSTGHGLSVGQTIVLSAGTTRNTLVAAEDAGDTVVFTTTDDHDLTEPSQPLDDQTCVLGGLGEYKIVAVPDRRRFSVAMAVAPTLDGTQYLVGEGLRGLQTVASVVNENSFVIDVTDVPPLPAGIVDGLKIITGFRIAGAADYERAVAAYSTQTQPYIFVIMGDADTSKDRHTLNDSTAGFTRQNDLQLKIRQSFSTAVFLPTINDLTGVNAQDKAYDSLLTAQMQCLLGYAGEDDNIIQYLTVPTSHGSAGKYNSAYYCHSYSWEFTQVVDYQDGFTQWPDVAFRDLDTDMSGFELKINLDEG